MEFNNLENKLKELIDIEIEKRQWSINDKFYNIRTISIDQRGRVGEHFFKTVFEDLKILNSYEENAHGDWDLIADGLKIEVKTATLDVNNKFQHEGVKASKKWDVIAFLDITPNEFYITFIHKNQFVFDLDSLNNKNEKIKKGTVSLYGNQINIHFRGKDNTEKRATGAGYKVDFKLKDLKPAKTLKDIERLFFEMKELNNL